MEMKIKMHDVTISISNDYDDVTLTELYDYFNSMLIGCTFTKQQIDNYIIQKASELEEEK
jgi:hypothetical protein